MFRTTLFFTLLVVATAASAEPVFKIEVGRNRGNSNAELERRVWELERAVFQLQQKTFNLEKEKKRAAADSWICTIRAMGEAYTGTGNTKAVATHRATKACKDGAKGNSFFCKDAECAQ